jgi:hypothetical protein
MSELRPISERIEAMHSALEHRIARPADVQLGAFAVAMQTQLRTKGPLYDFAVETLEHRPDIGSSHLLTLISKAFQARAYKAFRDPSEGFIYPEEYTTEAAWHQGFSRVLINPDLYGDFFSDVRTREPQSNVMDRYKIPKAFAVLTRRLGRLSTFSFLDMGSSLNVGPNYLASGIGVDPPNVNDNGLQTPEVIRPGSLSLKPNLRLTAAFNRAINADLPLDFALGIDKSYPADAWDWAYACSYNPSELLNEKRIDLFNRLVTTEYPNVGFYRADLVDLELDELARAYPGKEWGLVNLSAILYQLDPQKRHIVLEKAKALAKEFVMVSDFMQIDQNDPRELAILDDWNKNQYSWVTTVWDVTERSPRWHQVILSTDGRADQLTIGQGRIRSAAGRTSSLWTPLQDFARG